MDWTWGIEAASFDAAAVGRIDGTRRCTIASTSAGGSTMDLGCLRRRRCGTWRFLAACSGYRRPVRTIAAAVWGLRPNSVSGYRLACVPRLFSEDAARTGTAWDLGMFVEAASWLSLSLGVDAFLTIRVLGGSSASELLSGLFPASLASPLVDSGGSRRNRL
ncbi:MAG: hypothetical protein R3C68_11820 [Myxococcota bacterium]